MDAPEKLSFRLGLPRKTHFRRNRKSASEPEKSRFRLRFPYIAFSGNRKSEVSAQRVSKNLQESTTAPSLRMHRDEIPAAEISPEVSKTGLEENDRTEFARAHQPFSRTSTEGYHGHGGRPVEGGCAKGILRGSQWNPRDP